MDEAASSAASHRRVAKAALLVMAAFTVSRLLGLVRQVVFGAYFGTGPEMDAYVAAQRLPEMIFLVVAGGALGSAFIPTFTGRLALGERARAWRLASSIINLLIVLLVPISAAAIAAAPWLVRTLIAPALPPEVQMRTAELMRVMLLSTTIFAVSGVVMGILNGHQHFLLPALAPILYNVALIVGAIWGAHGGMGAMGAAIGMVVGAVLHLLVQVPGLIRYHARYTPTLGLGDEDVREVGRLMLPRVFGVAAVQINLVITNNLASRLGMGAISALDYAWRLMLLPQGVFAQAVGTAVFPTFSEQAARGDLAALRETLRAMVRIVIVLMLPATVGLVVLGEPLIALFFQRGAFGATSTRAVAWALAFFALGLTGHSLIEILARAFYALHDTWTPALTAAMAVGVNVGLGLLLPPLFRRAGMPAHAGLALANALAALVEMGWLLRQMERRLGGLGGLADGVFRAGLASLLMGGAVWLTLRFLPPAAWLQSMVGVGVGVAAYALAAQALGIDELRQAVKLVLRKR